MVEPKFYVLLCSVLCQINARNILLEFRAYDKMVEGSLTFQQSKLIIQWCYIRQNVLSTFKQWSNTLATKPPARPKTYDIVINIILAILCEPCANISNELV